VRDVARRVELAVRGTALAAARVAPPLRLAAPAREGERHRRAGEEDEPGEDEIAAQPSRVRGKGGGERRHAGEEEKGAERRAGERETRSPEAIGACGTHATVRPFQREWAKNQ
jgi:hypothetical protein